VSQHCPARLKARFSSCELPHTHRWAQARDGRGSGEFPEAVKGRAPVELPLARVPVGVLTLRNRTLGPGLGLLSSKLAKSRSR
jgi:hypothetical protein